MTDFQIRRLPYNLTSQAGLALVGQYLKRFAQIEQIIDPLYPVRGVGGIATSSAVGAYVGLLCTGKSDFDVIEGLRRDAFFSQALGLQAVPSSPTLRQRLDTLGADGDRALGAIDEANLRLLKRARVPIDPLPCGHVALDFDVFPMNNANTTKEGVSRTYAGFDGYAPIAAYLGEQGWCVGLELRAGSQHSAQDTPEFLARVLPRAGALVAAPILARADAAFDGAATLEALLATRAHAALDVLIKWNPRRFDIAAAHQARCEDPATVWHAPREGKRVTVWREPIERGTHTLARVTRLSERSMDRHGQLLLVPQLEIEGWLTTLSLPDQEVIALYEAHGTHEQFHSEFKTDLDLERLPSGKFGTNDLVLTLAMLAYNILRAIGQATLLGPQASVRHPAKRRRLRTVMQEIIGVAARMTRHAHRWTLGLSHHSPAFDVFDAHHRMLCASD